MPDRPDEIDDIQFCGWSSRVMARGNEMISRLLLTLTWLLLARTSVDAQLNVPRSSNSGITGADTKIATVSGRDVLRSEVEPPPEWLAQREKHVQRHGITSGFVSVEEYRRERLYELIVKPLFAEYRGSEKLDPTEEELREFVVHHRRAKARAKQHRRETLVKRENEVEQLRASLGTQKICEQERRRLTGQLQRARTEIAALQRLDSAKDDRNADDEQDRRFAQWWLANWKLQQSLYRRYGGRVIHQQVGPEAIDAMRDFLREKQSLGRFSISDKNLSTVFWSPLERADPGVLVRNPAEVFEKPWSSFEWPTENE